MRVTQELVTGYLKSRASVIARDDIPNPLNKLTKSSCKPGPATDQHLFADPAGRLRGVPTLPALRATACCRPRDIAACDGHPRHRRPGPGRSGRISLISGGSSPRWASPSCACPATTMTCRPCAQRSGSARSSSMAPSTVGNWRVLLLDSTIAGQTGGALSEASLAATGPRTGAGTAISMCWSACTIIRWPCAAAGWTRWDWPTADAFFAALEAPCKRARDCLFGHVHQSLDMMLDGMRSWPRRPPARSSARCPRTSPSTTRRRRTGAWNSRRWVNPDGVVWVSSTEVRMASASA